MHGNAGHVRWKKPQRDFELSMNNPRATQLREYTLKEFWEIFVDYRPFGADSTNKQVNVQSKAVCSHAMILMDEIQGWEDEESWVGSKFAACMWIYMREALSGGLVLDRVQEEYLRKRMMSSMNLNRILGREFIENKKVARSRP